MLEPSAHSSIPNSMVVALNPARFTTKSLPIRKAMGKQVTKNSFPWIKLRVLSLKSSELRKRKCYAVV